MENILDNSYKILQVSQVFISKYQYNQVLIKQYSDYFNNELFLFNRDDKNYQIIRITTISASETFKDRQRIETYLAYFNGNSNNYKFLDIHISYDKYDEDIEDYDYLNLETNYSDGIDLKGIYPEIYNVIHDVKDTKREIKNMALKITKAIKERNNAKPFFIKHEHFFTYLLIGICIVMFLIQQILQVNYDPTIVSIYLGADYKTFTLGLHQFYRLITSAFLHSGWIHIICNMFSLYSVGRYVEYRFGHINFLLITFTSILFGSLCENILSENGVCIGMSAGIYGLFLVFIIDLLSQRVINLNNLLPTIFINIYLNFGSNTAWIAHIGGMIGGFLIYMIISKQKDERLGPIILFVVSIVCLFIKYLNIDSITKLYTGTDMSVLKMISDLGFDNHAKNLFNRLIKLYERLGK